jgi:hypothetical protein
MTEEDDSDFKLFINNPDPPTITIETPVADQILSGTSSIRWEAQDGEDSSSDLLLDIELSGDGGETWQMLKADQQNSAGTYTFDTTPWDDGEYIARLTVEDLSGATATAVSEPFMIYNNDPPTVSFVDVEDYQVISGDFDLTWEAEDEEDPSEDLGYYLYYMDSNSVEWQTIVAGEPNEGVFTLDTTDFDDGNYQFKLEVVDTKDERSGSAIVSLEIYNPDPPVIKFPDGPTGPVSGNAVFTWEADDPDSGEGIFLEASVYISQDGTTWDPVETNISNNGQYELDVSELDDGTYQVKIVITDSSDYHLTDEHIFTNIQVDNPDPPSVEFTSAPSEGDNVTGDISFDWSGEDPDEGDSLTYDLYYRTAGESSWTPVEGGLGLDIPSFSWNTSGLDSGDYQVRIVAKDQTGKTTEKVLPVFHIHSPEVEDEDGGNGGGRDEQPVEEEDDGGGGIIIAGVIIAIVLLLIVAVLVVLLVVKKRKVSDDFFQQPPGGAPTGPQQEPGKAPSTDLQGINSGELK